jgi:hypothetical protein
LIKLDPDTLNLVDEQAVADAVIHLLDKLQDFPQEVQIFAIQALYRLMLDIFNLEPRHILQQTDRILRDGSENYFTYRFQAVKSYIEQELKNGNR